MYEKDNKYQYLDKQLRELIIEISIEKNSTRKALLIQREQQIRKEIEERREELASQGVLKPIEIKVTRSK